MLKCYSTAVRTVDGVSLSEAHKLFLIKVYGVDTKLRPASPWVVRGDSLQYWRHLRCIRTDLCIGNRSGCNRYWYCWHVPRTRYFVATSRQDWLRKSLRWCPCNLLRPNIHRLSPRSAGHPEVDWFISLQHFRAKIERNNGEHRISLDVIDLWFREWFVKTHGSSNQPQRGHVIPKPSSNLTVRSDIHQYIQLSLVRKWNIR